MTRTVSATLEAAVYQQETNEVLHILVAINTSPVIRLVDNTEDVISNGNTYTKFGLKVDFPPADGEDRLPSVRLTICNIDRSVIRELRSISAAPPIDVSVVLASDPDTVECGPLPFTLKTIDWDSQVITAELGFEDILNEPFPAGTFTPTDFGGLF